MGERRVDGVRSKLVDGVSENFEGAGPGVGYEDGEEGDEGGGLGVFEGDGCAVDGAAGVVNPRARVDVAADGHGGAG